MTVFNDLENTPKTKGKYKNTHRHVQMRQRHPVQWIPWTRTKEAETNIHVTMCKIDGQWEFVV